MKISSWINDFSILIQEDIYHTTSLHNFFAVFFCLYFRVISNSPILPTTLPISHTAQKAYHLPPPAPK